MPRKKLIRTSDFPYHITTRTNNRDWFYAPIEKVWKYFNELMREGQEKFAVEPLAFVLMSNHYHLMLRTPLGNIDKFMQFFNQQLGRKIAQDAGRVNRIFGAGYKWSVIQSQSYYLNVLRYIYQNPLRAGLVGRCQDYPYSDLNWRLKLGQITPLDLQWIETPMGEYDTKKTKANLHRWVIDTDNGASKIGRTQ